MKIKGEQFAFNNTNVITIRMALTSFSFYVPRMKRAVTPWMCLHTQDACMCVGTFNVRRNYRLLLLLYKIAADMAIVVHLKRRQEIAIARCKSCQHRR